MPGPATLDLDFERPAQKRADENQQGQDQYALQGRFQGNRTHNVSRDQDLEAKQQGPAQPQPELSISLFDLRVQDSLEQVASDREKDGCDNNDYGQDFDGYCGRIDPDQNALSETVTGYPGNSMARAKPAMLYAAAASRATRRNSFAVAYHDLLVCFPSCALLPYSLACRRFGNNLWKGEPMTSIRHRQTI